MHKEIPTPHRTWGQTILLVVLILYAVAQLFVLYPMSINVGQGLVPWLIGHGKILYVDIYENRAPLTPWIIALVQPLLGSDTFLTVRLLHLLVVLLTILLVYIITLRLSGSVFAACAAILYLTALQSVFVNVLFYYEVLQGLLYIGVICLLMNNRADLRRLFAAGILLGLALLTKQQAVISITFTVLWSLVVYRRWRPTTVLIAGVIIPVALAAGWYMLLTGTWICKLRPISPLSAEMRSAFTRLC